MDSISSNMNADIGQLGKLSQTITKVGNAAGGEGETGQVLNTFGDMLKDQMHQINTLQAQANEAQETYAVGGDIELHNVILAADKADMALQLATQIRNKLVAAYQEVERMQV